MCHEGQSVKASKDNYAVILICEQSSVFTCTDICSSICLFADDCILYRIIEAPEDHQQLQSDLNSLMRWTMQWQIKLNSEKCVTLRCTRSPTPHKTTYLINEQPLQVVDQQVYLGVKLHIYIAQCHGHIISRYLQIIKATKMLNFARKTLCKCDTKVKATTYTTLV